MIVALAGGVGGAKLAYGLDAAFPNELLTVVVNTADDFVWHGLKVCPDLDTVMYTLGGWANTATGWGVADDNHTALSMLATYGQDPWFTIGDRDLATHVLRTDILRRGGTLTEATAVLARAPGFACTCCR
ncbi:MAG: 2-phospho-L-lactate transferase CofD family protein [Chloroflexia bacterium]